MATPRRGKTTKPCSATGHSHATTAFQSLTTFHEKNVHFLHFPTANAAGKRCGSSDETCFGFSNGRETGLIGVATCHRLRDVATPSMVYKWMPARCRECSACLAAGLSINLPLSRLHTRLRTLFNPNRIASDCRRPVQDAHYTYTSYTKQ